MGASWIVGIGAANMFAPQLQVRKLISAYKPLVAIGGIGYSIVSYNIFHKLAGFDNTMWKEFTYAKICRMLRNVQIQQ